MKIVFERLSLSFVFIFLTLISFNVQVFAQDLDDVSISGRIVDSNNAPVAGASVTATLITTGIERTVTANEEGRYRIIELAPGIYSIKATMQGFASQEKTNLETVAGQNVQLDFNLAPAGVNAEQIITLEGDDAPIVDTTRTIVGGTITEREVEEIPNFNRNALDLVLTLGGTSEESLSTNGLAEDRNANPSGTPLEQGNFSLSGGTAYSNNLTIDGLDNNDDRSSRDRFQPSLESVAEVQVISNQFSAEYGRASGGRINIRTRAGGNKFRGRLFMFFRDDNLNANTWYNNSRNIARPALTEYNPGFTFSGPVILPYLYNGKNKTFFSVAYEYTNLSDTTLIDAYVPVGANPRFTLPGTTGGEQTCDSATTAACTSVPPTAAFVSPYRKLFSTPSLNHVVTARVDHKLFKNNDLTVGWQFGRKNNQRTNGTATSRIEDAFQIRNNNTDAINFTDNQVFGSNIVNQFRAQYSVYKPSFQTVDPLDPVVLISYRDPVSNSVKTLIAGNSTTSTSQSFADSRKETRWQIQDSLTYIWGRHTFKGGADVQRVDSQVLGLGDATGTFNFGSVLNYTNNIMSRFRQNFGTAQDVKNTYWGIFFNDEMKVRSNLTLNYGLRYERETAVSDNNNFGPRLGIAWDPFKKGKGVIRFGAGIFYNRVLLRTVADSIQNQNKDLTSFDSNTIGTAATDVRRIPILAAIANRFPNSYATPTELKALITATCATIVTTLPCNANTGFVTNVTSAGNPLRSVDADLKIPESYQFNIGFEREVGKGFVFEANYTWNKTVHLWRDSNPNAPRLPAGYADWTAYLLANPVFQLSPTRSYTFYSGSPNDGSGITTTMNGTTTCTTTTVNCFVNLNTINTANTAPLVAVTGQNNNATGSPLGIALAAVARFRPDQTVEETSQIGSRGNAFYQGLILEFRSRYRKFDSGFGVSMRFNYTLSSTKDDGLNNTSNAEINGDFSREWARNLQDRRHRIGLSGTFDMPWWLGKLKFSPLFRYGSSAPFNLGAGGTDRNLDDVSTDRLNFTGNLNDIIYREPGSPFPASLASQFSLQPIGAKSGNLPRNSGHGPSFYTFDLSVTREWKIGESIRIRPVIQFDNILNAAVFSYGSEFIDFTAIRNDGTAPTAAQLLARDNFLVPTRTYRQRQIRLGIRFDF
jgi:hypothetical protein